MGPGHVRQKSRVATGIAIVRDEFEFPAISGHRTVDCFHLSFDIVRRQRLEQTSVILRRWFIGQDADTRKSPGDIDGDNTDMRADIYEQVAGREAADLQ